MVVNFKCPAEQDFDDFDLNHDGILTWDEYNQKLA